MHIQLILITLLFFNATVLVFAADNNRFEKLLPLAELSNAIYSDQNQIKKTITRYALSLEKQATIPGLEVSYLIAKLESKKQYIIAVRGTANAENAMVDMDIKLVPEKITGQYIHQGFSEAASTIFDAVKNKIDKNYTVSTTGHSLGGAVALVLAMQLDASDLNIGKVVTFGQPKVTNLSGAQKFQHLNITRFVRPKDIVPLVPPLDPLDLKNLDIYWHLGEETLLLGNNQYAKLTGLNSMKRSLGLISELPNQENVENHAMTSYLALVIENSQKAELVEYKSSFNPFGIFGQN